MTNPKSADELAGMIQALRTEAFIRGERGGRLFADAADRLALLERVAEAAKTAFERIDALTRIDEMPPPDHEEGTCIDCAELIHYDAGLEATEPERCNDCHATWASMRMTDCGNIAREALSALDAPEPKR